MQNLMVQFTSSVLYRKHPFWLTKVNKARLLSLRPYGSRDFQVGNCYQHGFFIFFNNLKPKQTFYFHA